MIVTTLASEQFLVEFESEDEFRAEYEANLSAGGLCFQTDIKLPEFTALRLTLRLTGGGQIEVPAMVVRVMDSALAVAIETPPEKIQEALAKKADTSQDPANQSVARTEQNAWDRVRNLTRMEKLLLAPKAERGERAVLMQDKDPQIVYSLLKNPRISTEEVLRIARSPLVTAATVELIAKTTIWTSSSEIRAALVHNARTPTPLALKLLPTLPEPEIRQIAKSSAVSQALKQAALRIVINRQ